MKDAVDPQLRDQQAGFQRGRSCTEQIATMHILEQSCEWNFPLYVSFIDYEKACGSLGRQSLRELLRHNGVPEKITGIVRNSYSEMTCRMVCGHELTCAFPLKTGVRQGCLQSSFLLLLAVDWVLKTSTAQRGNGIQWSPWTQLDDLDFADDLALLSHTQWQMEEKTSLVSDNSARLSLKIHRGENKVRQEQLSSQHNAHTTGGRWIRGDKFHLPR